MTSAEMKHVESKAALSLESRQASRVDDAQFQASMAYEIYVYEVIIQNRAQKPCIHTLRSVGTS